MRMRTVSTLRWETAPSSARYFSGTVAVLLRKAPRKAGYRLTWIDITRSPAKVQFVVIASFSQGTGVEISRT